jgi:hypothetical protein
VCEKNKYLRNKILSSKKNPIIDRYPGGMDHYKVIHIKSYYFSAQKPVKY